MPQIATTKDDLLRSLETERDWWRAVLDLAVENTPLSGAEEIDGSWTIKEVVAHVSGWRDWTLARLEAAARGSGQPTPPWPESMPEETMADVDAINAWFTEQSHGESFDTVTAHLFNQLDALKSVVSELSDDVLLTPGKAAWLGEGFDAIPIGPALLGWSIAHAHEEHAPALEAWLTERLGRHAELPPTPSNFGYDE